MRQLTSGRMGRAHRSQRQSTQDQALQRHSCDELPEALTDIEEQTRDFVTINEWQRYRISQKMLNRAEECRLRSVRKTVRMNGRNYCSGVRIGGEHWATLKIDRDEALF